MKLTRGERAALVILFLFVVVMVFLARTGLVK